MSDKKEAIKELAKIVREAKSHHKAELKKAQKLADKYGLSFVWNDSYGNREQEYLGKGFKREEYDYETDKTEEVDLSEGQWTSSSEGC
jgi:hypothetical protein